MTSNNKDNPNREETLPDDDVDLFRRTMSDARPLEKSVKEPARPRISPRARFARRDEYAVLDESMDTEVEMLQANSGDSLRFNRPAIGKKTMRKLLRGSFSVQAEMDLHGMTASEARDALREFIDSSARRGLSCVRVIHGKGLGSGIAGPVLKRKVDVWLRQWDRVLAFVSARPNDGGTGAIYVLLKT